MINKTFIFIITFLTITSFSFGVSAKENGGEIKRHAIILGANDGGSERVKLLFAENDAKSIFNVMKEIGGLSEENTIMLLEPNPQQILDSFRKTELSVKEEKSGGFRTQVLFYYSGHSNENGLLLGKEIFSYKELRKEIDSLESDVKIAIVDSCASGAMTREKGGTWKAPFMVDESSLVKGHAILTSSSATEVAQESDRIEGSYFTHYVVSGLRGAADTSNDKKVTLNEAYQYAFNETLKKTESTQAGPQHPSYDFKLAGAGDLVLTDLTANTSMILIPANLSGHFFIRDSSNRLVAEITKPAGKEMRFSLEEGVYTILYESNNGEMSKTEANIMQNSTFLLAEENFTPVDNRTAGKLKGEAVKQKYRHVTTNFSLLPSISTNSEFEEPVLNNFSFNFLLGEGAALEGFELSFIGARRDDYMKGVQLSYVYNSVGEHFEGVQIATFFNHTGEGDSYGAQIGGLVNISEGNFLGAQIASANINLKDFKGAQIGVFNYNGNNFIGGQISTININSGNTTGTQVGAFNYNGEQFKGLQISALNYNGGKVHGIQIGAINYAEDSDFSLGLISIVKNGRTNLSIYEDDLGSANIELKHGGKYWHTIYSVGAVFGEYASCKIGFGLGGHYEYSRLFFDADFLSYNFVDTNGFNNDMKTNTIRLSLGVKLTERLALTGAFTNNFETYRGKRENPSFIDGWKITDYTDDDDDTWNLVYRMGFQFGVQYIF